MSSASHQEQKPSQQTQEQRAGGPAPSLAGHSPTPSRESSLSGMAGAVKDKTGDFWDSAKEGAQHAALTVARQAENAWDEVSRFVRRHPWATLAAGGGLTFLLIRSMTGTSRPSSDWTSWRDRFRGEDYPGQERGSGWNRSRESDFSQRQRGSEPSQLWEPRESRTSERASSAEGGSFSERAQDLASTATERVGQAWESTREGARQWASTVADRAGDAWETMGDWGRGYPLGTLLVGVALGFGLDELLRSQGVLGCRTSSQQQHTAGADINLRPGSSRF